MLRRLPVVVQPLLERARDLAPILLVLAIFQGLIIREPLPDLEQKIAGLLCLLIGLALFVRGLAISLFPLGEGLAHPLAYVVRQIRYALRGTSFADRTGVFTDLDEVGRWLGPTAGGKVVKRLGRPVRIKVE